VGFYKRPRPYGRYGRFGDVVEAQDAVNAASAKVQSIQVERQNQVKLIAFTRTALNKCSDFSAAALFTAGASVAVCVAEQQTALGQREGQLAQIDLRLNTAKGELAAAQALLSQARSQAANPSIDVPSSGSAGAGGSGSSYATSDGGLFGGGGSMFSNPLVIGGGVLVLGIGAALLMRKKNA